VDKIELGGGMRYVASRKLRGSSGCAPVVVKYGERPIRLLFVTLSAQMTEYVTGDQPCSFPLAAL
jgi:hypothetical protein